MIGTELGHYRIEEKLGEGGMGVVYKALDLHLDRPVAIKVLGPAAVSDDGRKRRFVQEARTASALNHPNILHIYDINQSNGIDFIAMEFVAGKTLDWIFGPQGLPLSETLDYAVQIAGALARAHEAGIVHRDLKPANVMVTAEGLVKVLDFGLAKLSEPRDAIAASDLTATLAPQTEVGTIVGTVQYMSPEQAEGKTVDARSDIFSFGVLLYEMATGQRPFRGDSKLAILSGILSKEPAPLREVVKNAHPELDRIVSRCLQKEPGARFQRMSEVKAALEELRETLRTPSTAASRPTRRKWLWAAGAVPAAALLVAVPFAWRQSRGAIAPKLVAVLPFQTAADPDAQAFAGGLVETLSRNLSRLNRYQRAERVLPPDDVRGDAALGPAEARKKLGADLVLTGTLQQAPGNVRCDLKLLDARTSEELKRLEIEAPPQSGLLKKAAEILDLRLPSKAEEFLAAGNTKVPQALEACLRGYGYLRHKDRPDDVDRAASLFQEALAKDPSYGLAHAGLAESLWAKSQSSQDRQWAQKARESCLRAIAANADLPAMHLLLGKIAGATGRPRDAVEELQKTLQLDPLNIAAHTSLGEAYEALGQVNDSEGAYQDLVKLWPNYLVPYSHLASFYVRQGRYKDAEPPFRKVVELAPENSSGYQNLGAVYHLLGREDDAAAMMKKSLAIKPSARGYTNLGTLYFFQGRYSDAVPLMERAVEMDRNNYVYWGNLGDAYRWAPEYKDRAPQAYRQAIELAGRQPAMNPNDADLLSTLADYYAKLPDRAKALAEIAQARRLAPMNPNVLFKAALVYEVAGRRDQAVSALDLALQAGYSIEEVRRDPELADLRKDPQYARLDRAAPAASGARRPQ
jgi:tetratricopeptide (TPR) repeat protein/predicted Ser/Thr protein kinase